MFYGLWQDTLVLVTVWIFFSKKEDTMCFWVKFSSQWRNFQEKVIGLTWKQIQFHFCFPRLNALCSTLPHLESPKGHAHDDFQSALTKIDGRHDSHEMLLQCAFLTYGLFSVKLLSKREKKINKWIELFIKNSPRNKIQMMKELKRNKVTDSNACITEKSHSIVRWWQVDEKGAKHLQSENFNSWKFHRLFPFL